MSRLLNTIVAVCFGIYPIIVHANIPVGIECPCEISRINETKAEVNFSLVFQPDESELSGESGDLNVQIIGANQITFLPPYLSAKYPPRIIVIIYPK